MRHLLTAIAALLCAAAAHASPLLVATNHFAVAGDEAVERQLFLVADTLATEGALDDDAFLLVREQAALSGEVGEDLWLMAGKAVLQGHFLEHVRAAGQQVLVTGILDRDLYATAQTVHLATNAVIGGSLYAAGNQVSVEGGIGGDVRIAATSVTLGGTIEGDVSVAAQDIVVLPGTIIGGHLSYLSPRELVLDSRVTLGGELIRRVQPAPTASDPAQLLQNALLALFRGGALLLAALPLLALFSGTAGTACMRLRRQPARCLMSGFALLFAGIPIIVIATITLLGIPLALLLAAALASAFYIGPAFVALALGGAILRRQGPQSLGIAVGAMALGLLILYSLSVVPLLGGSIRLVVSAAGAGALVWTLLAQDTRQGPKPPPVPDVRRAAEPAPEAG